MDEHPSKQKRCPKCKQGIDVPLIVDRNTANVSYSCPSCKYEYASWPRREHDTEFGADCWCEPKAVPVDESDPDTEHIYVHHLEGCTKDSKCQCR